MLKRGKLYLIPVTLGDVDATKHLPLSLIESIAHVRHFVVEDIRSARRILVQVGFKGLIDELTFYPLNKNTDSVEISAFLQPAMGGLDVGLLSEAGNPCIADPGATLVALAHRRRVEICPLVGPSSILLALISSGLNGQQFAFNGYLPKDRNLRIERIKQLEKGVEKGETQIFMETPYRNNHMMEDLLNTLKPETRLCVAVDLTLPTQHIEMKKVKTWNEIPNLHKRPAIFLIG